MSPGSRLLSSRRFLVSTDGAPCLRTRKQTVSRHDHKHRVCTREVYPHRWLLILHHLTLFTVRHEERVSYVWSTHQTRVPFCAKFSTVSTWIHATLSPASHHFFKAELPSCPPHQSADWKITLSVLSADFLHVSGSPRSSSYVSSLSQLCRGWKKKNPPCIICTQSE